MFKSSRSDARVMYPEPRESGALAVSVCKRPGSGHARTLSVDVRGFIRPDSRAADV